VVGVVVREEQRVNLSNVGGEQLQPQLRRRIYEKERAVIAFDARPYPASLVPRITRVTDLAIATDLRNPEACSRAEESQLQSDLPPGITGVKR
jgi:hypothetical protein